MFIWQSCSIINMKYEICQPQPQKTLRAIKEIRSLEKEIVNLST